jgi:NitT/TauT family transport system substrate-binding protein
MGHVWFPEGGISVSEKTTSGRRQFKGLAAAVLLAAAFPAASVAQNDLLELRLAVADGDVNPVTDSVLKLADSLGYYERHGVRVTIVPLEGTPQAVAALTSGAVDLADISIDAALRLRAENNVALRGVASATLGPPFLIAARCDVASVADLVGKTYAISDNGGLDHNLTQHVLAANGVARDGPEYVVIGPPAVRAQALAAGQVDATTISYGSFLPIAQTPGLCILVPPDQFFEAAPNQSKFVVALEETIDGNREAIQRFVNAIVEASRDFDQDPAAWVAVMAEIRTDLTAEGLQATTPLLEGRWCVNGCLNVGYIQGTVDFIYDSPDFAGVPVITAADVTDETFVLSAIGALGPFEGGGIDAR